MAEKEICLTDDKRVIYGRIWEWAKLCRRIFDRGDAAQCETRPIFYRAYGVRLRC